jgi:glutathione S-transferase
MRLIGYLESPFVRRVAVTAEFLGLRYELSEISIIREYERFREFNPLVKAPTLVCDDGQWLVDSSLIIDYLESLAGRGKLMPADETNYIRALNIVGTAMVANEKTVQLIYELKHRPEGAHYQPWADRVRQQLTEAMRLLEEAYQGRDSWLFGDPVSQADITTAIAWYFCRLHYPDVAEEDAHPALVALSARAENLPEFRACPVTVV